MNTNEYMELFISEGQEILTNISQGLIRLEKNPEDKDALDEIFRGCHTLKGNAAAMGIERVVHLAHAMENVLSLARSGKIVLASAMTSPLFEGLDTLGHLLEALQQGKDSEVDETPLIKRLQNIVDTPPDSKTTADAKPQKPAAPKKSVSSNGALKHLQSIRINLDKLESLLNTVGELHIFKIRLRRLSDNRDDHELTQIVDDIERIANQLQEETMQMRLLPLKYLFNYFPRMLRDDARQEGKEVELTFSGADIGLDRTILDEIHDPLVHILRNAVSHGIETPEKRQSKGKSPQGHIHISAQREQAMVTLSIQDDGAGIDKEALKKHLIQEGIQSDNGRSLSSEEALLLMITKPGLSLSKAVTERAGRGMGMNIVKNKIDAIGGSLSIQSTWGKGTTFTLRLPISMAIIHALLIRVNHEVYAIPLHHVSETIKINTSLIKQRHHHEMIPFRNSALPLIHLKDILSPTAPEQALDTTDTDNMLYIVVCENHHQTFGLVIDQLIGEQEIVIKNIEPAIHSLNLFSGATILGNGHVAFILDITALVAKG